MNANYVIVFFIGSLFGMLFGGAAALLGFLAAFRKAR